MWGEGCSYDSTTGTFTFPGEMNLNRTVDINQQSAVLREWGVDVEAQLQEDAKAADETGEEEESKHNSAAEARPDNSNPADGTDGDQDKEEKRSSHSVKDNSSDKNAVDEDEAKSAEKNGDDQTSSPTSANKSTLDKMVRDKEKVDAATGSPSDDVTKRTQSWVATKSAN